MGVVIERCRLRRIHSQGMYSPDQIDNRNTYPRQYGHQKTSETHIIIIYLHCNTKGGGEGVLVLMSKYLISSDRGTDLLVSS